MTQLHPYEASALYLSLESAPRKQSDGVGVGTGKGEFQDRQEGRWWNVSQMSLFGVTMALLPHAEKPHSLLGCHISMWLGFKRLHIK